MNQQRICASGLIVKDDRILIAKRSETDDFLPGYYELPGGGVEFGEDPKVAAARELFEEIGVAVEVLQPLDTFNDPRAEKQVVEIIYLCQMINSNDQITLSAEHSEYKWVKIEEIDNMHISEEMKQSIKTSYDNFKKLIHA